jgi:hypothetical protein
MAELDEQVGGSLDERRRAAAVAPAWADLGVAMVSETRTRFTGCCAKRIQHEAGRPAASAPGDESIRDGA